MTDKYLDLLSVVSKRHVREAALETAMVNLCEELQLSPEQQWETGGGPVDIYLHGHRTLIECKAFGKIKDSQIRTGGPQFEQLRRYVVNIRQLEASYLQVVGAQNVEWTAVLTDGQQWLVWKWQDSPGAIEPMTLEPLRLDFQSDPTSIIEFLRSLGSDGSKPLAPESPHILYANDAIQLHGIWERARDLRGAQVQFNLWWDSIRASGMDYGTETEAQSMFVRHCALVSFARAVRSALLDPDARDSGERNRLQTEGFINWICQVREGQIWIQSVQDKTNMFDWRKRRGDILQVLYQEIVPKTQRKVYGEYYTPDWLASMLAEELLDEAWCRDAVQASLRYQRSKNQEEIRPWGVLDPTCGSGTFLYYATRRLVEKSGLRDMELTREEQADVVSSLVFGVDIHPVAVEFAQTTLLRSLPAPPTRGDTALNIWQGDSLLAEWGQGMQEFDFMRVRPGQESFTFRSPKSGRSFTLPRAFVVRADFARDLKRFTDLANAQKSFPADLFVDMAPDDFDLLKRSFSELQDICHNDGNGIWAYHVSNWISPTLLAERKVNRILANPPWITLNTIQNPNRKETFKDLATRLDLWMGGTRASSFDVASTFVVQCSNMYLADSTSVAGWVLNSGSVRASTWKKFRAQLRKQFSKVAILELNTLQPPFASAAAVVWYLGTECGDAVLEMHDDSVRIKRNEPWEIVRQRIQRVARADESIERQRASDYVDSKTEKPLFREGASLRPHVLVRVGTINAQTNKRSDGLICGKTRTSRHKYWSNFSNIDFEVPACWVRNIVTSSELLLYTTRSKLAQAIVPTDNANNMLDVGSASLNKFWRRVNRFYEDSTSNKGSGTPKNLIDRIDHFGGLTSQLKVENRSSRVVYNAHGADLRAARIPNDLLIDDTCYRFDAESPHEALYLVGILNAHSLQKRFSATRETDRDFHTQFWLKVPIPRYSPDKPSHLNLIETVRKAEDWATQAVLPHPEMGQIKLCKRLRAEFPRQLQETINELALTIVENS